MSALVGIIEAIVPVVLRLIENQVTSKLEKAEALELLAERLRFRARAERRLAAKLKAE